MLRRILITMLIVPPALMAVTLPGFAETKQVPVARIHAQIEIGAPPAAVWTYVTTGKNMVTWCPVWKSPANATIHLTKVGDALDFTDQWGNGGRSIVTYVARDKELRVAHEPNDGSYMCQAKITLTASGAGTAVNYTEQYTDESAAKDFEATAQKMQATMAQMLAALKKGAEKGAEKK